MLHRNIINGSLQRRKDHLWRCCGIGNIVKSSDKTVLPLDNILVSQVFAAERIFTSMGQTVLGEASDFDEPFASQIAAATADLARLLL